MLSVKYNCYIKTLIIPCLSWFSSQTSLPTSVISISLSLSVCLYLSLSLSLSLSLPLYVSVRSAVCVSHSPLIFQSTNTLPFSFSPTPFCSPSLRLLLFAKVAKNKFISSENTNSPTVLLLLLFSRFLFENITYIVTTKITARNYSPRTL